MTSQLIVPSLERVPWKQFITNLDWEQGEHVSIIAGTGRGKSVMARALCWKRDWVGWLSTKKKDTSYDDNLKMGYVRIDKWPPPKPPKKQRYQRAILWPKYKSLMDIYNAAPTFNKMLEDVYKDECWTVVFDDLYFLSEKLKLREQITALQYQVRSIGSTSVCVMQRPRKIPLETWDQSSWLFLRPLNNYEDMLTMRAMIGQDMKVIRAWMGELQQFEWLCVPISKFDQYAPCIVKPPLERIMPA